jgi:hypothetical protein
MQCMAIEGIIRLDDRLTKLDLEGSDIDDEVNDDDEASSRLLSFSNSLEYVGIENLIGFCD